MNGQIVENKTLKVSLKKFTQNLQKATNDLEEYSKSFPIALPYLDICRALNDQQSNKKKISKFYEEGLAYAEAHGMKYITGIIKHLIGISLNVRDDPTTTAEKMQHKESALQIFIQLNVGDTQLLWPTS